MQASQVERDAALALGSKSDDVKSVLHYDTTSRSKLDGDWPSIIVSFSDGRDFELRPIFFAYENREQIVLLLVETYERLSVACSELYTPIVLWEKTVAVMTDSVNKNLKIEDGIGESLNSTHRPYHLLCKPHTVEKLDVSNIIVLLSKVEALVKQRDTLESISPRLKSFFRGKKTTVEAGIDALMTLVTHDKSGKTTSLADLFDMICEREGVTKRIFLFQQRRFAKLGKSAASLVEAFPILRIMLDEVTESNQLIEACKIYMSSKLFLTELPVLAYFNYCVSFPLLNCIEKSSQAELLETFPRLYADLENGNTSTLREFVIEIRRVPVKEPTSELGKKLIELMCIDAADGIMLQCGREYGFSIKESNRATNLSTLTKEQLKGLPTGNLKAFVCF